MIFSRAKTCLISLAALLVSSPALADKIKHPTAVFSGLDKITGRIISFEVAQDETVQFGSLQITSRVCYTRPATEAPQTTTFVEVDEVSASNEYKRIFSGWMFAASPGLHGIEHSVYDIWLTDCKGGTQIIKQAPDVAEATPDAPPVNATTAPKPPKPGTVPRPRRVQPVEPAPQAPGFAVPSAPEPRREAPRFLPPGQVQGGRDPAGN
jgi:hypothetical protein